MTSDESDTFYCSFVSIDYIICECGETFPSEDDLRTHLEKEHPHKKERKEYKCGICSQIYPTEQECVDHYEQAHIEIKLEHNYVAEPKTEEEQVILKTEKPDNVQEEYEFSIKTEPDNIQEEYEYSLEPIELVLDEGYCDINNVGQVMDVEQVFEVGKKRMRQKKEKKDEYSHSIVCEVCGKKYASNAALRYHQRIHTGERPYQCPVCAKTFTTSLFLKIHIRTHTGERPYQCPHCPKAFSNKTALLRHDRVHTGIKPYECPECGKAFTQSNSMKLHVNTVHLKMPAPYKSKTRRLKEKLKQEMLGKIKEVNVQEEEKEFPKFIVIKNEEMDVSQDTVGYMCEGDDGVTYSLVYE